MPSSQSYLCDIKHTDVNSTDAVVYKIEESLKCPLIKKGMASVNASYLLSHLPPSVISLGRVKYRKYRLQLPNCRNQNGKYHCGYARDATRCRTGSLKLARRREAAFPRKYSNAGSQTHSHFLNYSFMLVRGLELQDDYAS